MPQAAAMLEDATEDILAHKHFAEEHRRQLHARIRWSGSTRKSGRRYFSAESMARLRAPLALANAQELLMAIA